MAGRLKPAAKVEVRGPETPARTFIRALIRILIRTMGPSIPAKVRNEIWNRTAIRTQVRRRGPATRVARAPLARAAATEAGRNLRRWLHAHLLLLSQAERVSRRVAHRPGAQKTAVRPAVTVQVGMVPRAVAPADTLARHST